MSSRTSMEPRQRQSISVKRPPPGGKRNKRGVPFFLAALVALVLLVAAGVAYVFLGEEPGAGSPDGGPRALATLNTKDIHSLAISPEDANTAYFGHHDGLLKTTDGGRTWKPFKSESNWDAMALAIPRSPSGTFYVAGHDVFFKSPDGGQSFQAVRHNLPGTDIHGFAADPDDAASLYAFVVGAGLFHSSNGGTSWERVTDRIARDTMALGVVPGSPKVLLAGTMDSGLLRSTDGGATWSQVQGGFEGTAGIAIAATPGPRATVLVSSEFGVFGSRDAGVSWSQLPLPRLIMALAISPQNPDVVMAVDRDGKVYRSSDGGMTW